MASSISFRSVCALLVATLSILVPTLAVDTSGLVQATVGGQTVWVRDNRRPSLYTGDFGDCLGSSSVNVTRFDAAYYKDNMTVLFHLAGNTALKNESLMMYIGVYAYGENRFDLTFNPCSANINSLCPMNADVPISANGIIPISQQDVAGIPPIALSIPDFEGQAILRIFSNSTQAEIGCFSAVLTNGESFSQPASVGSILGIFTFIAVLSSFATAVYGESVPVMRKHYAHSLSVLVVFAVWHHIFFSGALSMNWPSVLVAFWSNYAWAGGMIHTGTMQNSIDKFIGSNRGNTSFVGAAGVGVLNENLGGGYDIHTIYKRTVFPNVLNVPGLMRRAKFNRVARHLEQTLAKRELADSTDGFGWYGKPVPEGLPLPGNYSGFAGTLGQEHIPASNAFMTGFLWFLILIAIVAGSVIMFKGLLEAMVKIRMMKNTRLVFFRNHYLGYTVIAVLRTLFIGFFMIIFLCLFQFTYLGSAGPIAIASIVFVIMFVGMFGIAAYACFYRVKFGNHASQPDRLNVIKRKGAPWIGLSRASSNRTQQEGAVIGSLPWWAAHRKDSATEKSIHDDEDYTKKFGWLASRFRRTRWWFFVAWLVYEFIRACFLGGASGHPMTQVFGLLVVEFIAFIGIIIMRPFEAQRLNAIVVYLLGFSKVATVALSAAFDVRFNLARIPTTAIGIVIIVIQGILTIVVMIAIVVGAISSYMSVMRNREDFRPRKWAPLREKYFNHLDKAEKDVKMAPPAPEPQLEMPEKPKGPYFSVNSIKRVAKIEDEDPEFLAEITGEPSGSQISLPAPGPSRQEESSNAARGRRSRAASIQSQLSLSSAPYGARVHRASWSSRDFSEHSRERRYTVGSNGPFPPDGSGAPSPAPYRGSLDNLGRAGSPFTGRTSLDRDNSSSPLVLPRTRPSMSSPRASRPSLSMLERLDSESVITAQQRTNDADPYGGF
ncbi:TRP-domain-containing protein [Delitschia confertaspora ATCC 74209]|uniref:TRP-domain-containing protein n=1 Tax=Delitschia confertaspora ATCC 74209 TaxID=1513339 RepID=A0A9P4MTJ3_9PLEO|nr:TRP-domain-containing protein [Delitschia confertaspora ATCC 74209]